MVGCFEFRLILWGATFSKVFIEVIFANKRNQAIVANEIGSDSLMIIVLILIAVASLYLSLTVVFVRTAGLVTFSVR